MRFSYNRLEVKIVVRESVFLFVQNIRLN